MSTKFPTVYLFKAASEEDSLQADRYTELLSTSKITSHLIPVLVFDYTNLAALFSHLSSPQNFSGIVLTSPRCVHAIREAVKKDETSKWPQLRDDWESGKYLFCVGPSTSATAETLFPGGRVQTGLESHAESLAEKIIQVHMEESLRLPLLYPCGAQRREILSDKLTQAGIPLLECAVYKSIPNPDLGKFLKSIREDLKTSQDGTAETFFCFFSPSGVSHVLAGLDGSLIARKATLIAIGPTTKSALESHFPEKTVYQCKNPTPEALLEVISSVTSLQKA